MHLRPVLLACVFFAFMPRLAVAQFPQQDPAVRAAMEAAREADHRDMMTKLGISDIRRGRNGMDPEDPNYANYDESKANPYPSLPDPLLTNGRQRVTTPEMWWEVRRPELVEFFDREIYGRVPNDVPAVTWTVTAVKDTTIGGIDVQTRSLNGHVDNAAYPDVSVDIQAEVTTPTLAAEAVPVVIQFGFIGNFGRFFRPPPDAGPSWQEQLLARGWGYAILSPNSIQADNGAGLREGVIGLTNKGAYRKPDDWGALRAWAWGASRLVDFFETDDAVDATRVGITGHSRYGKAAAVAMAYDPRIAITFVSSSGEGGLKLHRRDWGEIVENVAGSGEYHWMAGNFIKYAGPLTWDDLPVDAHELIALCAPRPVFISSGDVGDYWVDARGMFLAGAHAGPVYELLGVRGLGTDVFPPLETGLMDGEISFRQHAEGHTPGPNWPTFIEYAARYFDR